MEIKETMKVGQESEQNNYVKSMSEKEKKAYLIAKEHLGSLFSFEKTIGFINWKEKQNKT